MPPSNASASRLSSPLKTELVGALLLFGGALGVGFWLGRPLLLLCLAQAVYLAWLLGNLWWLRRWLMRGAGRPPRFAGLARELANYFKSMLYASSKRKRKRSGFQKRLREAIAALPEATVIIDRKDQVQWCNPAARLLLGLDPTECLGQSLARRVPHVDLQRYIEAGEFENPLEITWPIGSGRRLSIQVTTFGNKHQRLLVASDITTLHNLDRVRRDFVANVSHELRTPLTVMSGFLETLVEDAGTCPEWARSVELMDQQARRMQSLVNDLLALSKLEMNNQGEQDPIPVPTLLLTIAEEARRVSGPNQHHITLDADPSLWLVGTPGQLRGAFTNLIINAVQHTPPGSKVQILWQRQGDEASLSVRDNGEGIPAKHLPRLTERFYRVDKARSRSRGGTGLGLAIVKHALTRHDSQLEVSSIEGVETRFECRFPASRVRSPQ